MQAKISKSMVDRIDPPARGQEIYWDTGLKGFGLRVTPTRKTYVAQNRVARRLGRTTIGLHGTFTPDQARKEAKRLLWKMATGINTNRAKRRQERYSVTLGEAFVEYKAVKSLAASTLRDYEEAMRNAFCDWSTSPIWASQESSEGNHGNQSNQRLRIPTP